MRCYLVFAGVPPAIHYKGGHGDGRLCPPFLPRGKWCYLFTWRFICNKERPDNCQAFLHYFKIQYDYLVMHLAPAWGLPNHHEGF